MEELSRTTDSTYRPSEIKVMIGKYNPIFDDNGQHDAGELLSTVLSHLNEDLNTVSNKRTYKIDTSVPRTDDELLQEYIKKDSLRSHSVIE
jgi:ubiquitin C-terminal hydrolase